MASFTAAAARSWISGSLSSAATSSAPPDQSTDDLLENALLTQITVDEVPQRPTHSLLRCGRFEHLAEAVKDQRQVIPHDRFAEVYRTRRHESPQRLL
jgi:hypothetical protein